jgi:glycosyltransferase involved in cell wall biosynthesis
MTSAPKLGLIINTHNQPEYLARVLNAVSQQSSLPEEVLLADDGSGEETREVLRAWAAKQSFGCEHLWQKNEGFRRSRILNQSIAKAQSDYLVFLDGDTVPHPQFIADHRELAQRGWFVQGHRALVERKAAQYFGLGDFAAARRRALFQWQLSGVKNAFRWPRPLRKARTDLRGVRGCNLAIWREDLIRTNGYNEAFVGWGREDSELALRLMNSGVRRLDVRGRALCYHLWHPPASRTRLPTNDELLEQAKRENAVRCALGLNQYLPAS